MKKFKILFIAAAGCALLCACGNKESTTATHSPEPTSAVTDVSPSPSAENSAAGEMDSAAESMGDAAQDVGDAVGDAAEGVGDAVNDIIGDGEKNQ